jgi:hypothetical protein
MSDPAHTWLARYQPHRRQAEIGFWVLLLTIHMLFNSITAWMDRRSVPFVEPLVWELTSNLTVGLLIPAVLAFERRFPLRWATLGRHLPWHLAGTVVFCGVHVLVMMLLRQAAYAAVGASYTVGPWPTVFVYEYLKDVQSYALILCAALSYRLLLLRAQGEARLLDVPEAAAGAPPAASPALRPERFLVRKLRSEFLIAANDIEWLQAQGNYVGLHVNGHDYLLRSTLADFLGQLDPARFAQVHRSFAVNLDRVAQIEPLDSGDARLHMKDGSQVACSRRYRNALGGR